MEPRPLPTEEDRELQDLLTRFRKSTQKSNPPRDELARQLYEWLTSHRAAAFASVKLHELLTIYRAAARLSKRALGLQGATGFTEKRIRDFEDGKHLVSHDALVLLIAYFRKLNGQQLQFSGEDEALLWAAYRRQGQRTDVERPEEEHEQLNVSPTEGDQPVIQPALPPMAAQGADEWGNLSAAPAEEPEPSGKALVPMATPADALKKLIEHYRKLHGQELKSFSPVEEEILWTAYRRQGQRTGAEKPEDEHERLKEEAAAAEDDQSVAQPPLITEPQPPMAAQGADGAGLLSGAPAEEPEPSGKALVPMATPEGSAPPPSPPIDIFLSAPPLSTQPGHARRGLVRVVVTLVAVAVILALVVGGRQGLLLIPHPARVATVTEVVTVTFTAAPTRLASSTPTRIPTATPARVPTATAPPIAIATAAPVPTQTAIVSVTWTFRGPGKCDWDEVVKALEFPAYANIMVDQTDTGSGCTTGAAKHYEGQSSLCTASASGSCTVPYNYSVDCCATAPDTVLVGSHHYFITDYNGHQVDLTVTN